VLTVKVVPLSEYRAWFIFLLKTAPAHVGRSEKVPSFPTSVIGISDGVTLVAVLFGRMI